MRNTISVLSLAGLLLASSLSPVMAQAGSLPDGLRVEKTSLGEVYANAEGKTLYEFKKDMPGSGKSACVGECAKLWPPQLLSSAAKISKPWGVVTRADGKKQLSYAGYPLYTWIGDKAPGETSGQGVKGLWRVAKVHGPAAPW
ncbi:COG4315 family predicted lipoprotein [Acidithiobacillus caldus]